MLTFITCSDKSVVAFDTINKTVYAEIVVFNNGWKVLTRNDRGRPWYEKPVFATLEEAKCYVDEMLLAENSTP